MGKNMAELLRYTGNMAQISGIREMTIENGRARGMRLYHVYTGCGLEFDLLPDKAMDIARVTFKGVNINWQAKTGFASPVYAHPVLNEFDRYFSGGMLTTCGFKNTGPDYVDHQGRFQALHGRIGITPCEQSWYRCHFENDDYILEAGGVVRDAMLCSHNLTLTRTVKACLSKPEIEIEDILENQEPTATDYVILYHFNFGFPFVSPDLNIDIPQGNIPVKPRTEWAEKGLDSWMKMEAPEDTFEERCYFHEPKANNGICSIGLENKNVGIKAVLSYENENLPILTEWKSIQAGEYVLGIEPGNSYIRGMDTERQNGRVDTIEGFEKKVFRLKLAFSV